MNKYRDTTVAATEVREITPAMASEMLAKNMGNRRVDKKRVNYYASQMREGSWKPTHQGIAVSTEGNIIDGQHRLSAIVAYGKPVEFVVTTMKAVDGLGELTATNQPIDIGKLRSISDITGDDSKFVSAVRHLVRDYLPNGKLRAQDPQVIASSIDILRPSLEKTYRSITTKGLSVAPIRSLIAIRHYTGFDVTEYYDHALHQRYHKLSQAWGSWALRVREAAQAKGPQSDDFRKIIAAMTWQVTDPNKDLDQKIVIRDIDGTIEKIRETVRPILLPALRGEEE